MKTATEISYTLQEKQIKKIYKFINSNKWKNKKIEIEINTWTKHIGKFICKIEKFIPYKK